MSYEMILTEIRSRVGLITLNRPKALNALNNHLMREAMDALEAFDNQEDIGAMLITGSEKAFAAGADIKEMADQSAVEMKNNDYTAVFDRIRSIRKPVITTVMMLTSTETRRHRATLPSRVTTSESTGMIAPLTCPPISRS